jgi:hypothetical protein
MQVFNRHLSSLRFQADSRRKVLDRALGKEEPVMKKKLSIALVLGMVLMLAGITAVAAIAVRYSENANKINLAREALYEKYGLTPQTLGLFVEEAREENGAYLSTWTCNTFHPTLTGVYSTVVVDGQATASWTYDDVDKAVYESGDFSAPIWGQKQLEASFSKREEASEYSSAIYDADRASGVVIAPDNGPPVKLEKGERYWQGEVLHPAEPTADALTGEEAFDIAVQALVERFGMDKISLEAGYIRDQSFLTRENGGTIWDIGIFVTVDGVQYDCVVRLDGITGEVLSADAGTGGNG